LRGSLSSAGSSSPEDPRRRARLTAGGACAVVLSDRHRSNVDVIETERLLLEPMNVSRVEDFVALTADPNTMRYWALGGPFTRDAAERNFVASLARLREHGFGRRWIVAKANGAGLGFTETKYFGQSCDDVSPDEVEIGWMLTPRRGGRDTRRRPGAPSVMKRSSGSSSRASLRCITPRMRRPPGSWKNSA
jgi:Acetyltransferase (GNAT) domain